MFYTIHLPAKCMKQVQVLSITNSIQVKVAINMKQAETFTRCLKARDIDAVWPRLFEFFVSSQVWLESTMVGLKTRVLL
jgi:hypothetical protein